LAAQYRLFLLCNVLLCFVIVWGGPVVTQLHPTSRMEAHSQCQVGEKGVSHARKINKKQKATKKSQGFRRRTKSNTHTHTHRHLRVLFLSQISLLQKAAGRILRIKGDKKK
jgi:hypothetical protein